MSAIDWSFSVESPDSGHREAYVGLRERDGKISLRVPYGYPTGNDVANVDKPAILGELIRAIARISAAIPKETTKQLTKNRDGFLHGDNGHAFSHGMNGADISYSGLSLYFKLFSKLFDPRLLALMKAPGLTAQFDHRHISRNLHRATFLPDGTPVFDHLWAPRAEMRHTTNDMVGLACWLALDGVTHLFPDGADMGIGTALQAEWQELAHRFAEDHDLQDDDSLFSEKRKETLQILQAAFEVCHRRAPPVSSDSRELAHLLDELLNHSLSSSGGDIFGLKGFYHVWEAACLEWAIACYGLENICTCDDAYLTGIDAPTRQRWDRDMDRLFAANGIPRRPDLMVKKSDGTYLIVDFKYQAESDSKNLIESKTRPGNPDLNVCREDVKTFCRELKAYQDITNIEIYRWLLMQHELKAFDESRVDLELWVPGLKMHTHRPAWMKGLAVTRMPAREIIGAYARKFRLDNLRG